MCCRMAEVFRRCWNRRSTFCRSQMQAAVIVNTIKHFSVAGGRMSRIPGVAIAASPTHVISSLL